jgi:hypothetical protein
MTGITYALGSLIHSNYNLSIPIVYGISQHQTTNDACGQAAGVAPVAPSALVPSMA